MGMDFSRRGRRSRLKPVTVSDPPEWMPAYPVATQCTGLQSPPDVLSMHYDAVPGADKPWDVYWEA